MLPESSWYFHLGIGLCHQERKKNQSGHSEYSGGQLTLIFGSRFNFTVNSAISVLHIHSIEILLFKDQWSYHRVNIGCKKVESK